MEAAVKGKLNVIVSGGTGSGKTTLLKALSSFIPDSERVITIEDAAELRLQQRHVLPLETRPDNVDGKNGVSMRDLVRNSLRMRPDRIIIGECRGAEALDMLQAMNSGHEGSLTTLHANGPRDALTRLETMLLMAGFEVPIKALRRQIQSAINLIVQADRLAGGARKVTSMTEVVGMEGDVIVSQEIFLYQQQGIDSQIPVFEGDAATVRQAHQDLLAQCDGIVVFYGAGDEAWKRSIDSDLRKLPAYRGDKPLLANYTYLAQPTTADKTDLIDLEEPNLINGLSAFDDSLLSSYLQRLTGGTR